MNTGTDTKSKAITSPTDLNVYKAAYELAMAIFNISKTWPIDERFALTGQIRRSSRSVCSNLREAWAKRRYEGHFISKLTDVDGENSETETWLNFAMDCGYLGEEDYSNLSRKCRSIGKMIGSMLRNPQPFISKTDV